MKRVSVLMVDDHPIVRDGYCRLLERQGDFHVCAQADSASQAYRCYKEYRPDVVIMDVSMPGAGGLEAVRHICELDRNARILVFSMYLNPVFCLKAFEAGALGYVTKSNEPGDLVKAASEVAQRRLYLSADVSRMLAEDRVASRKDLHELGPRAIEIFRMLALGMDSESIGRMLSISHKTVRNYHYEIKAKMGARNDAHLVWRALEAGLVDAVDLPSPKQIRH